MNSNPYKMMIEFQDKQVRFKQAISAITMDGGIILSIDDHPDITCYFSDEIGDSELLKVEKGDDVIITGKLAYEENDMLILPNSDKYNLIIVITKIEPVKKKSKKTRTKKKENLVES
jgi:hypothetical protein